MTTLPQGNSSFVTDYTLLDIAQQNAKLSDQLAQNSALASLTQISNDIAADAALASEDLPLVMAAAINLVTINQTANLSTAADATHKTEFTTANNAAITALQGVTVGTAGSPEATAYAAFISDITSGNSAQAVADATAVMNALPTGSNFGYMNSAGTITTTGTDGAGTTDKLSVDSTTWQPTKLVITNPDGTLTTVIFSDGDSVTTLPSGEILTNRIDGTSTVQEGHEVFTYPGLGGKGIPSNSTLDLPSGPVVSETATYDSAGFGVLEASMTFWSGAGGTGTPLAFADTLPLDDGGNVVGLAYNAPGVQFSLGWLLTGPVSYEYAVVEDAAPGDSLFVPDTITTPVFNAIVPSSGPVPGLYFTSATFEGIQGNLVTVGGVDDNLVVNAGISVRGTTVSVDENTGAAADITGLLSNPAVNTVSVGAGANVQISSTGSVDNLVITNGGTVTMAGGTVLTDPTTIEAGGIVLGNGVLGGDVANNGTIVADGGTFALTGNVTGSGAMEINPNAALNPEGTIAPSVSLLFTAPSGTLLLGASANFGAPISGAGLGDAIALEGQQVTSAIYDAGAQQLAIMGSTGSTFDLSLVGTYQQSDFTVTGGEVQVACFLRGTRVATQRGAVAVEHLKVGDHVPAQFKGASPVKWIGRRYINCRRHPTPQKVWPVRVRADAFGPGLPMRDLWLSPDHAVFANAVLIPVRHLVNGSTIAQVQMDEVIYYHVELSRHDVLYAEGMPAESYLDTGNRADFENDGSMVTLHPDFDAWQWEAEGCAPLIVTGPICR